MLPKLLFLACAFFIALENIIIERKFAGLSPLGSQPIYALCYLIICASLFPLSKPLGMSVDTERLQKVFPWVLLAGLIFAFGAIMFFQAFAKGGTAQMSVTVAAMLPILVAILVCLVDRRLPSTRTLISCALAVSAILVLHPETQASAPTDPAATPSAVDSDSSSQTPR
jgi:uncharacterized membrane protein